MSSSSGWRGNSAAPQFKNRGGGGRGGGGNAFGRGRGRGGGGSWRGGGGWRGRGRFGFSNRGGRGGFSSSSSSPPSGLPVQQQQQQQQVHTMTDTRGCPFRAWKLYLPAETFSEKGEMCRKVRAAKRYLERKAASGARMALSAEELMDQKWFHIDAKGSLADEVLKKEWPELEDDLRNRAETAIGAFGLAKHQTVLEEESVDHDDDGGQTTSVPVIRARLVNFSPLSPIQDLKTRDFGRLVSVRGTVVRVSSIKPACSWLAFECTSCRTVQSVSQPYGRFVSPFKCSGTLFPQGANAGGGGLPMAVGAAGACRGKKFSPVRNHRLTITVDWQSMRLQEMGSVLSSDAEGSVPRTIECEMTEDLCDSAVPGDVVTLTGVVKNINLESDDRRGDRLISQLYIHAMSVVNSKSRSTQSASTVPSTSKGAEDVTAAAAGGGIEFTYEDYSLVQEIEGMESQIFKLLVHSLCPSIYGHELVKAGLILGLFGGTSKFVSNRTHVPVRGDPHILVVGDPGLGKSQMLSSCANVAPRGVFVTGNTTTTSGLTVTLTRESGNDFALEAGALVLADQGVCCIDEFDKMGNQHHALLEAMEQQSISLAKSGVVCSLPARTAVLAAANPIGGHYNRAKTVSENLKMNPALLSRFDLVFVLIDKPNEELDGLLSEHILKLHASHLHRKAASSSAANSSTPFLSSSTLLSSSLDETLLIERLRKKPNEKIEPIPHEYLQKYIAYARQYVSPKLDRSAGKILQDFYVELRQRHHLHGESTPITLRQLESLVRLTEARAKLELREEATAQDAMDVIEIFRTSLADTLSDEKGTLDFSRSSNGSGMSSRGAAKKFISALQRQANSMEKSVFTIDEMKLVLNASGATVANFLDFLSSLNTQGYLIKKSAKTYQLLSADY